MHLLPFAWRAGIPSGMLRSAVPLFRAGGYHVWSSMPVIR
jgi:hypothetical protein